MHDLISQQAAKDMIKNHKSDFSTEKDYRTARACINAVPPAQQWIPCSERLPEEHESIWAKAKGTDRWSEAMWEKQSDEVIVTELFEDDTTRTDTACTHDGEWYVKVKMVKRKIIAWMPLPEPYKERREEWLI